MPPDFRKSLLIHLHCIALLMACACLILPITCLAQVAYNFGNTTTEEQLYLEYINRARANPPAEGARLAATTDPNVLSAYSQNGVDLTMMQNEFNAIAAQAPLAPNAILAGTARSHSNWMLTNASQSHNEGTVTPWTRMTNAGYNYSNAAENIFAYSKSVWYGHAGFQVDWGSGGTGGMQAGRGHRVNIHNGSLREIGVGVTLGSNGSVGPQLVTQDFGTRSSSPSFGLGVAYYDLNANNFYDIGEGISGLTVNVSGTTEFCNTAIGGGWCVVIPNNATTRTVTFSGLGMNQTINLVVPASQNAKADLKLTYAPPTITSAATAAAGSSHTVTFNAVGGAASYKWNRWTSTAAATENCNALTNVTTSTTAGYNVLSTTVKQEGTGSFHLINSTGLGLQTLQLNGLYFGTSTSSIAFQSRIRYATSSEKFKVQVKEEGSVVWQDVFNQVGSGSSGEAAFNARSAAISGLNGKAFRVRFILDPGAGSHYLSSDDSVGWFIDAISFTNTSSLGSNSNQTLTGTSGSFTPSAGTYVMSVSPIISGNEFIAAYQTLTVSSTVAPTVTTHPQPATINSGATKSLTVAASGTSPTFQWYAGPSGNTSTPVGTGATFNTPALTITTTYWARATNAAGTSDSNAATVTVITPPTVTTHPQPATINSGATKSLAVAASGSSPTFQWYAGASGNTSTPVGTGATFNTPALTTTTTYWARASNATGTSDSNAATVTVITPPTVTTHPQPATINSGATKSLAVAASGSSPTFQWYAGPSGNTSTPVGTGATFNTPALTTTTTYWARATNAAGSADSNAATIVVNPPFTSWAITFETSAGLTTGTISNNPNADYDKDGKSNLIEYAFGCSPVSSNDSNSCMPKCVTTSTHFVMQYQKDTALGGITFRPEACTSMQHWSAPGEAGAPTDFSDVLISTNGTLQTREARIPRSVGTVFMRITVNQP